MPFYYYYYYFDIIFSCLDFWPHFSWFWQRHRRGGCSPGGALTALLKTILWQGEILDLEILEHLSLKLLRFLWRKIVIKVILLLIFSFVFLVRFNAFKIKLGYLTYNWNHRTILIFNTLVVWRIEVRFYEETIFTFVARFAQFRV